MLCPRRCGVDRTRGRRGFCNEEDTLRLGVALLHFGEEPPISGEGGSGAVFFPGCTLQCAFCQNYQLSSESLGGEVSSAELAGIFLKLRDAGAENINLITGTHFTPGIAEAVDLARQDGLGLPIVWNTSGYEAPATLSMLDTFISMYLPDIKTVSPGVSKTLYGTPDYAEAACTAVRDMVRSRPLRWNGAVLEEGVIVRHMVLPGRLDDSRDVFRWFAEALGDRALFSLLFQYTPMRRTRRDRDDTDETAPVRRINREEYETVLQWLDEFGIEEGFVQEYESDAAWLPDFTLPKPFPAEDARVIWRCD